MKNQDAVLLNNRLDVPLFNELNVNSLELNKFTKKQIKKMMIDDLIAGDNTATDRLNRFINEILNNKQGELQ
jgi:nicotinamide mononucleotide adenylyltransferase